MSVSKHLMCVNLFSFYNHSAIFIPVEQIKNNNNNNNNLSSGYLWRRKWQPTPGILPGKFYGQRSLAGYKEGFPDVLLGVAIAAGNAHFVNSWIPQRL